MTQASPMTLVADIGGTNTRVALAEAGVVDTGSLRRFRNRDFAGLAEVLRHYQSETATPAPRAVCVALAGPVRDGVGQMTNLNWRITEDALAQATGARTARLVNDLQAQGFALTHLPDAALTPVLGPETAPPRDAPRLVVGLGTGFNIAPVHYIAGRAHVAPAEAGQIALPTPTEADRALALALAGDDGFTALEQAISGPGLAALYAATEGAARSGAEILVGHSAGTDPGATRAVQHFMRLLGCAMGDLALCFLPFGGLYLCGGMSRAISPFMGDAAFQTAFLSKGRFAGLMAQFPLIQITDDFAALTGCARIIEAG